MDYRLIEQVLRLAFDAGPYRQCTLQKLDDCIFAAIRHGKALWWTDNTDRLVGLVTWCLLPHDKAEAFMANEYEIANADFTNTEGELIISDFMAPYGNVVRMMKDTQNHTAILYGEGVVGRWKRPYRSKLTRGYAKTKGIAHEHP